jgi:hypothetical protein
MTIEVYAGYLILALLVLLGVWEAHDDREARQSDDKMRQVNLRSEK